MSDSGFHKNNPYHVFNYAYVFRAAVFAQMLHISTTKNLTVPAVRLFLLRFPRMKKNQQGVTVLKINWECTMMDPGFSMGNLVDGC